MNFKNLILVIAIIIVVSGAVAFLISNQAHPKKESMISMVSAGNLTEGDNFTVQLTDVNGTPISNQNLSILIMSDSGQLTQKNLTSDANGQASFELDGSTIGSCAVKVKYGGNDEFNGCNFTDNIKINQKVVIIQTNQTALTPGNATYYDNSSYGNSYWESSIETVSDDQYNY